MKPNIKVICSQKIVLLLEYSIFKRKILYIIKRCKTFFLVGIGKVIS